MYNDMIKLKSLLKEDIIDSPEFKRWFGGSKAIDKHGNPRIMYHGTTSHPRRFSKSRIGHSSNIFGSWKIKRHGIFVSENPEIAREFADTGPNGSIMPLFIKAEAPIDLRHGLSEGTFNTMEDIASNMGLNGSRFATFVNNKAGTSNAWTLFDEDDHNDPGSFIEVLLKMDYDSAIIDERYGDGATWILFDPSQVKSAIGNIGKFDLSDPNIIKEYT
jgi:hypothetical protein